MTAAAPAGGGEGGPVFVVPGGQNVKLDGGRWTITSGYSTVVARVTSSKPAVILRWWLLHFGRTPTDEILLINGCTATLTATASLGTGDEQSAYVLAAEDGERPPVYSGFQGAARIYIYDPANAPTGDPNCTGSVIVNLGGVGIGRVTFQGVGTWDARGLVVVVQLLGVPRGTYTVTIETARGDQIRQNVRVDCHDRNYILVR